jgi:hypothetical protein
MIGIFYSVSNLLFSLVQVLSLLIVQILEFIATLFLLQRTAKPKYEFLNFFKANKLSEKRNWLLASILGFGFLFLLVFLTSILADRLIGSKVGQWVSPFALLILFILFKFDMLI